MLIHAIFSCFALTTAIYAQQSDVAFELHTEDFQKNYAIKIELKLKYSAINTQKILSEGRRSPTPKDHMLGQVSSNTHNWDITFDAKGEPSIKGSPQVVTFNFTNPLRELSNALAMLQLEGRVLVSKDGKTVYEIPFRQGRPFKSDTTYVLFVRDHSPDKKGVSPTFAFLTKERLKGAMEGKPIVKQTSTRLP